MGVGAKLLKTAFNKAGYRLVSKTTTPVAANGAVSVTKRIIEHESGVQKCIYSYLDKNGKAIQTIHSSSDSPLLAVRNYKRFTPQLRGSKTAYREKIDPYAFENSRLECTKTLYNPKTNEIFERGDTVVDINLPSRTVTRTQASLTAPDGNIEGKVSNDARITEIVKGKKTKEIYQRAECTPYTTPRVLDTQGFGLTPEQIKEATSNPYFYAMFKNPKDMIWSAKTQVFTNQNVPFNIKFEVRDCGLKTAAYYPTQNLISVNPRSINKGIKSMLIADFEHEARHAWQKRLVEKLEKGLLTDPQEIKMAQEFKKNWNNYIPVEKDRAAYHAQPLEDDAFKVTNFVFDKYQKSIDYLASLFTKAARKTLGE